MKLKIQASSYITTYKPGHYGAPGKSMEMLWKKVGSADIYEYVGNSSVRMVQIGDDLYGIDYNDCRRFKSDEVTESDLDFHDAYNKGHMTEYTSF